MTIGLFPKGPLVVTLKRKLILHQEIKPKYPQIQTLSRKIAVSVNFQALSVTQVWNFFLSTSHSHDSQGWGDLLDFTEVLLW